MEIADLCYCMTHCNQYHLIRKYGYDFVCFTGSCTVEGVLPQYRKACDNRPFCFAYAHVEKDPLCLHCLGVEDGNITDFQLSASSSIGAFTADKARLNGNSCWMPSGTSSSWIQANLGETRKVTGIVIQGCPQNDHWVTKYKLQHSMDGASWTDYTADGDVSKTGFVLHLLRENICISRIDLFLHLKMTSISCPVLSLHI
uniref:F5/8 type C domain-containing protein n=1 Tax=Poecilia reticulata TaxID=8081 RepID=A0A3P9N6S8_POERE